MSQSQVCRFCRRPKEVCHELVDERFPGIAREVFEASELETAHTCPRGQAWDLKNTGSPPFTFGWNMDRVVMHPAWTDDIPRGMDSMHQREAEIRALRPRRARG